MKAWRSWVWAYVEDGLYRLDPDYHWIRTERMSRWVHRQFMAACKRDFEECSR